MTSSWSDCSYDWITLTEFKTIPYTLIETIYIAVKIIEGQEPIILASWPEINLVGKSSDINMAISNLEKEIATLYESLRDAPDNKLGGRSKIWKKILMTTLKENL